MSKTIEGTCKRCLKSYKGRGKVYCSWLCKNNGKEYPKPWQGKHLSQEAINKIKESRKRQPGPWKGIKRPELKFTGASKTMFKKGHLLGKRYKKGERPSPETEFKKGLIPWNKGKEGPRGVFSYAWNDGATTKNGKIRRSNKYKQWRTAVFERDNYTCQTCGIRGGVLQVDHIRPFALYPELRFDMNNGRTLCFECHKKTPTYLRYFRSKEDVEAFLSQVM